MWIDVGNLIRQHLPDKNGNTLPEDLTTGSCEIRDLTNHAIGTLFEGKIMYDTTYGHVTYGCGVCCGYRTVLFWWDPLDISFLGTSDNGVNAFDTCSNAEDDVSELFYGHWTTANSSIATADFYGTHTGQGVGSTTTSTWGTLQQWKPHSFNCPDTVFHPGGGDNVTPTVTIGNFSQNPILQGSTATVTVTVNPAATIALAITTSASGSATFDSQGGSTTKVISGTTTVTIYGAAASSSTGDLLLTASYSGTALTYGSFSVTSGVCTLTNESDTGSGIKACPSTVTLQSTYTVQQYCPTCQVQCTSVHTDGTWTPTSGCSAVTQHLGNTLTGNEVTKATGTFSPTDCNWHYAYFVTTVRNAQNVVTNNTGASIGLKCTASPSGNPCP